jgi:hypothetical protein
MVLFIATALLQYIYRIKAHIRPNKVLSQLYYTNYVWWTLYFKGSSQAVGVEAIFSSLSFLCTLASYENWRVILTQYGLPQLHAQVANQAILTAKYKWFPRFSWLLKMLGGQLKLYRL